MKFLITGADGQLGKAFIEYFMRTGISFVSARHEDCDICCEDAVRQLLDTSRPDVVINCAAYNQVDEAEDHGALAFAVNTQAPRLMARNCLSRRIKMVHFSTNYVFDGRKRQPYIESDPTCPISVYGKSKLEGEVGVLEVSKEHLIFRVSWVIASPGPRNFLYKINDWIAAQDVLRIADDEISTPTFAFQIIQVVEASLKTGLGGMYHLASSGEASRYELTKTFLDYTGVKGKKIIPVSMASFSLKAQRPNYSVLSNHALGRKLGINFPDWRDELKMYLGALSQGRVNA